MKHHFFLNNITGVFFLIEFNIAAIICEVMNWELFHESVHYLIISLLILAVRLITSKIEKKIESLKKEKDEKF